MDEKRQTDFWKLELGDNGIRRLRPVDSCQPLFDCQKIRFKLFPHHAQTINKMNTDEMLKILKESKLLIVISLIAGMAIGGYFIYQALNNKISSLSNQVQQLAQVYTELKGKPREKSQDELLTEAVGRIAPAVVSIVITKDVPQLEVVYVNPFGDDPFFKDFGIRIPQYRQKGTAEKKVGAGTGFIVNPNGYIITNRHVAEDQNARYTVLLTNGIQKQATVIYRDSEIDVAVLKIEGNDRSPVILGNSDLLKLGQSVFAVGNALGEYNNSVSVGIVSGLNRNLEAFDSSKNKMEKLQGVIQTDAAINPGNSGGPLVNLNGEVIGINVAMASGENIGFSIPINLIKPIIKAYIK